MFGKKKGERKLLTEKDVPPGRKGEFLEEFMYSGGSISDPDTGRYIGMLEVSEDGGFCVRGHSLQIIPLDPEKVLNILDAARIARILGNVRYAALCCIKFEDWNEIEQEVAILVGQIYEIIKGRVNYDDWSVPLT